MPLFKKDLLPTWVSRGPLLDVSLHKSKCKANFCFKNRNQSKPIEKTKVNMRVA
jgi:hypothetical protein